MRDARNRDLLVDRVRAAAGIEIEVISGTQEAYLLKLGVESRVDLEQGRSLLVDVGGKGGVSVNANQMKDKLMVLYERKLSDAKLRDAIQQMPARTPPGSWARSRSGGRTVYN